MISPRVVVIICTSSSLARSLRAFIALDVIFAPIPPPPLLGKAILLRTSLGVMGS